MFTGIVRDVGAVAAIDKRGDWTVTITTQIPLDDLDIGASVACNGICITAVTKTDNSFTARFSTETLSKTTASHWQTGTRINLERALRAGDELGGHYVSGHVDGVARVIGKRREGDSQRFEFEVPQQFSRYLAPKGSIAIEGVSLTVNEVDASSFGVNLISHTLATTTLGDLLPGSEVNFEVDMIARYVERMMTVAA